MQDNSTQGPDSCKLTDQSAGNNLSKRDLASNKNHREQVLEKIGGTKEWVS